MRPTSTRRGSPLAERAARAPARMAVGLSSGGGAPPQASGRPSRSVPAMAARLDGTVALVTGASSGIGEATARALAAQGATVALVARRGDRLKRLAAELDGAVAIEADITQQPQAAGAVDRAVSELGRLDTLVNNAGVMI